MAVDQFLKLDGIKGEAQDDKHKGDIDILAWSWGMSQSGSTHMGSGSGAGKVSVNDISVTKYIDKSSPTLMKKCAEGDHIPNGSIVVRKAGKNALEYVKIDMENIIITSVSTGGSGGEDRLTENITLNFGAFKTSYTEQKADGSAGPQTEFGFDIAANKTK